MKIDQKVYKRAIHHTLMERQRDSQSIDGEIDYPIQELDKGFDKLELDNLRSDEVRYSNSKPNRHSNKPSPSSVSRNSVSQEGNIFTPIKNDLSPNYDDNNHNESSPNELSRLVSSDLEEKEKEKEDKNRIRRD